MFCSSVWSQQTLSGGISEDPLADVRAGITPREFPLQIQGWA